MEGMILASTASGVQINLDRKFFSTKQIKEIVAWIQIEFLAKKVNFDPSIEALGEEIHESWWKNNRNRFEDIIKESEKLQDSEVINIKGGKRKKASL